MSTLTNEPLARELVREHHSTLGQLEAALKLGETDPAAGLEVIRTYVEGGWDQATVLKLANTDEREVYALSQARGYQVATVLQESGGDPEQMGVLKQNPHEWRAERDAKEQS